MLQRLGRMANGEPMIKRASLLLVAATCTALVHAQRLPTAEEVAKHRLPPAEALQKEIDQQRSRAAGSANALSEAARRAQSQFDPNAIANKMPRVTMPDLPAYAGKGPDPLLLANQYKEALGQASKDSAYNLVVFASLSIPEEALKRIGRDVKAAGGVVVLRGLKYGLQPGGWKKSMEALKPIAETGVELQINPNLFQQFGVRAVPMVVVSAEGVGDKGCSNGECAANVGSVVGDVTLGYALELLSDRNDAVGQIAREKASRLR